MPYVIIDGVRMNTSQKRFTKLRWESDKEEKNDFNLTEKYVCGAYDPHNHFHTNDANRFKAAGPSAYKLK